MMNLSRNRIVTALLASLVLASCRGVAPVSSGNAGPAQNERAANANLRIVTDDLGRSISVPAKVTRVVSTAPSVTENIFAVGAGDRLIGVTTFCDYPEAAKSVAKIGDTMNPNIESIVALKPDIVFVSTASQIEAFMKTLEQNGIAVYVMNPNSIGSVIDLLETLATIFGTEVGAKESIDRLKQRWAAVNAVTLKSRLDPGHEIDFYKVTPIKVFVQISREPLFTVGKSAFLTDIVVSAGGKSVTANIGTAFPKLSKETALALNPEVIILSDSPDNQEPNEVFKNSPAVKNGRVYKIDADLLSRPGPRLVDALEQIAKYLHPEKFSE
ncbi:MAG: cobalamin-binding protein [Blastocatellia bacterium]|nr:cobalamin-binding protein [Blastocatellia bacterium]